MMMLVGRAVGMEGVALRWQRIISQLGSVIENDWRMIMAGRRGEGVEMNDRKNSGLV